MYPRMLCYLIKVFFLVITVNRFVLYFILLFLNLIIAFNLNAIIKFKKNYLNIYLNDLNKYLIF